MHEIDLAPFFYFSVNTDGMLANVNATLCENLGYKKDELAGEKQDKIFTISTRIFIQTHLLPLLQMQGNTDEIFMTLLSRNKEHIPLLFNIEKKIIDNKTLLLFAGIPVKNRKKFEEELIAAKKNAEASLHENTALKEAKHELQIKINELDKHLQTINKQNGELRQITRVITHDLQEPLRKILTFVNILNEEINDAIQLQKTEKIKQFSDVMRSMIFGLQQYLWISEQPTKATLLNATKILSSAKKKVQNENPLIVVEVGDTDFPELYADEEQVELLFYHLISNAVRFRKDCNKAIIKFSMITLQLNEFRNTTDQYNYVDYYRLQAEDTGVGFDPKYKDQTFQLFKRLHKNSGLGIGLSLCKKIAENHSGFIEIDSEENKGTVVSVFIPVASK